MDVRLFDLNIERILEAWDNSHAVRELIANALDEQILTRSAAISIQKDPAGVWSVRDFGRGLRYEHFTQNENPEKLKASGRVIGKFGIGLKDAVATLTRNGVAVEFQSKHAVITFEQCPKHGFADVVTLHARVAPPRDPRFKGTEIKFVGLKDADLAAAKAFFLKFSGEMTIEATRLGSILKKTGPKGRIYVAGLLIAEEENFAFSYNITSMTETMRKALNRERTNVGRTAYTERVKAMLLASTNQTVAESLATQLTALQSGVASDEVKWKDVAIHACKILNKNGACVFVTSRQLSESPDAIDAARSDGKQIVVVPDTIYDDIRGQNDLDGEPIRDLAVFQAEWNDSFAFEWILPEQLTAPERETFARAEALCRLAGGRPKTVKAIKVSQTMRRDLLAGVDAVGLWDPATGDIVIRRDQLKSVKTFAATLLHELAHASSGAGDLSRAFEDALTNLLGAVATTALAAA